MTDGLLDVVNNPAVRHGIGILAKTRPEIGLALNVVVALMQQWSTQSQISAAIIVLDKRAAAHIKRLATVKMSEVERDEIEIRLHEVLSILMDMENGS